MWPATGLIALLVAGAGAAPCNSSGAAFDSDSDSHLAARDLAPRAVSASSWAYLGCVTDDGTRLLATQVYSGSLNSQDYCVNACASAGYKYAGTQYGIQCWCANSFTGSAGKLQSASACSTACPGNKSQKCGAGYMLNLFANPSALASKGCYQDTSSRVLPYGVSVSSVTPAKCATACANAGYAYAGVESGTQCYCGNSLPSTKLADSNCATKCAGDSGKICGGAWAINVYALGSGAATTTSDGSTTPTTTGNSLVVASNAAAKVTAGVGSAASSGNTKYLWGHFMVGNTYTYTKADWTTQINAAKAAGIDGFALNMGSDSWQPARVADAYAAAVAAGNFKMFFSFDFSSFACTSTGNAATIGNLIKTYANNGAQAKYANKVLVSSFLGEGCTFGQSNVANGWAYLRKQLSFDIYFMPATFVTPGSASWADGVFNWNSAWPMDGNDISTATDTTYLSALGSKGYMPGISPFFFTYYGPNSYNKNWIYRGDNWLLAQRFEQLVANRNKYDMVELISWNDFGESHYVGEIAPAQDQPNSTGWTTGFPHTALLSLINLYATAFKTGKYPSYSDKIWLWSRPHPRAPNPTNPTNSRPTHWDWTNDNLYVVVTLSSAATVQIQSGSNYANFNLPAGMSKLAVASAAGVIKAQIVRGSSTVKSYDSTGKFSYVTTPKDYNYNYFVAEA